MNYDLYRSRLNHILKNLIGENSAEAEDLRNRAGNLICELLPWGSKGMVSLESRVISDIKDLIKDEMDYWRNKSRKT